MSNSPGRCDHCGQQLRQRSCKKCKGKGTYRIRIFERVTCPICNGTGITYVCPSQFDHDWEEFNKRMEDRKSKLQSKTPLMPKTQTCPLCKGAKGVPHPGTGMPGPCPNCNGRGWVAVQEFK